MNTSTMTASTAYHSTRHEAQNLTNQEVHNLTLELMADFSGDQAAAFIKQLARHHQLPVAVFSEEDVRNTWEVRRMLDVNDQPIPGAQQITPAQIQKVTNSREWSILDDHINHAGLTGISEAIDNL